MLTVVFAVRVNACECLETESASQHTSLAAEQNPLLQPEHCDRVARGFPRLSFVSRGTA